MEGNIRELKDEGGMQERHRARFCTRMEWLTVLLQCTEVSILVFAGLCGLPCSHTRVRAALITLPVSPTFEAGKITPSREYFRLTCLLDVSCNTAETIFL